ncbi:MAG: signal peptidase I [Candidatus Marinimicrobia bacterium]|nr:signal peptidase I [Candidatus Neomarinimicrobiota bacterium]
MNDRQSELDGRRGGWSRVRILLVGRNVRRTLLRTLLWAGLAVVLAGLLFRPIWTDGLSMAPTVNDDALRFANLLAYRYRAPRRGEIVVIRGPGGRLLYLKRILALPGETVAFADGQLRINAAPMPEPYVRLRGGWNMDPITLDADAYFVAGDNRGSPLGDHVAGVVRRRRLAGALW